MDPQHPQRNFVNFQVPHGINFSSFGKPPKNPDSSNPKNPPPPHTLELVVACHTRVRVMLFNPPFSGSVGVALGGRNQSDHITLAVLGSPHGGRGGPKGHSQVKLGQCGPIVLTMSLWVCCVATSDPRCFLPVTMYGTTTHPVPVMEHVQQFKMCYSRTQKFFTVPLDPQ